MLLDLLRNIALLIALTVIQQAVARHWRGTSLTRKIVSGIVFGVVAVLGMMTPVRFAEGVIYDGRSIILSVSGLFAGPLAVLIAALIAGAYRLYLGGSGALVGTAVIVESAALGAMAHRLRRREPRFMRMRMLWLFSVIVHAIMLLTQLALPGGLGGQAFLRLWPVVLGVYPLGSLLVCRIFLDQEERRRDTTMLRESEERYRLLAENTVDLIWKCDRDLVLTYVNPAVHQIAGFTPEEVVGTTLAEHCGPEAFQDELAALTRSRAALPDIEPFLMETTLIARDGREIPVEVRGSAFLDERGRFAGYQGTSRDITERRCAERAMQGLNESLEHLVEERTAELASANRRLAHAFSARTRFLRSMSHELRTPLNSIIGFSDILIAGMTGPLGPEQHKQVRLINDSGRHLLEIVNDILDLARVEAGRVELHPTDIDAAPLARELVESMQPQAARKALELRFATPSERIELRSDRLKLRQILLDLLGNAVKYTDRGSIDLTVGRAGREVVFVVRDTGRGIRPEMLERVFDEFSRDDDTQTVHEGSGLGLPIARALAQALGGRLTVESAPGEGSTFTLTMPAELPAPQTPEG